jgi:hypothetical protein
MTTYSTGNPIGSTDPRDLSDNSENFDRAVNNIATATWVDRFGVSRVSLAAQLGYVGTGTGGAIESYAAGLVMGTYNTIILYSGEFYRPSASATLPYTTTATLPDVDSNLASVGDAVLRQDLASQTAGQGASLVSMEGGPTVEAAVTALESLAADFVTSVELASETAGQGASLVSMEGGPSVQDAVAGLLAGGGTETPPPTDPNEWSQEPVWIARPNVGENNLNLKMWPIEVHSIGEQYVLLFNRVPSNPTEASLIVTGLAFSNDLINWKESAASPIFKNATEPYQVDRAWIRTMVWDSANSRWVAFTGGQGNGGTYPGVRYIGVHYSDDLINWTSDASNPIITRDTDDITTWGPAGVDSVYASNAQLIDGVWYLFVDAGVNSTNVFQTGLMTASTPSGPWTSVGTNPIINATGVSWASSISLRTVLKWGGRWYATVQDRADDVSELRKIGIMSSDALAGPWTHENPVTPLIQTTDRYVNAVLLPSEDGWNILTGDRNEEAGLHVFSSRLSPTIYRQRELSFGLVIKNTNQTITNDAVTAVTWQSSPINRANYWRVATPSRLYVPVGATLIRIRAMVTFAPNATGRRDVFARVNGKVVNGTPDARFAASPTAETVINIVSAPLEVVAGDYVEVFARQTSGGSLALSGGASAAWAEIEVISGV